MHATNFYEQLRKNRQKQERNADIMGSMSSNNGRPTYLNIGGSSYPRFGSEADANVLQMDKQLFIKNERDKQSRWQARKKFKY